MFWMLCLWMKMRDTCDPRGGVSNGSWLAVYQTLYRVTFFTGSLHVFASCLYFLHICFCYICLFCFVLYFPLRSFLSCFIFVFCILSLELCRCSLIVSCLADHVPDWNQPRIIRTRCPVAGTEEGPSVSDNNKIVTRRAGYIFLA